MGEAAPVTVFPSLHGYRRSFVRGDLVAGFTVWAVLVPEALAYATIAGARRSSVSLPRSAVRATW